MTAKLRYDMMIYPSEENRCGQIKSLHNYRENTIRDIDSNI
jgi:hypothetical protein